MVRAVMSLRYRRFLAIAALAALFVTEAPAPAPASAQNLLEALFGGFRRAMTPKRPAYADPNRTADGGGVIRLLRADLRWPLFPGQRTRQDERRRDVPRVLSVGADPDFLRSAVSTVRCRRAASAIPICRMPSSIARRWSRIAAATAKARSGWCGSTMPRIRRLRTGDIVATAGGLMTYRNDGRSGEFSPADATPGLSPALRRQLTATRVTPGRSDTAAE